MGSLEGVKVSNGNDPVRVRRTQSRDFDRWRVLWSGYLAFYRGEVPDHVTDMTFKRLCGDEEGMVGLVAVDADDNVYLFSGNEDQTVTRSPCHCARTARGSIGTPCDPSAT